MTIPAVVVVHAHNDPVDNIQSIGYHVGVWESFDRERKKRSFFHVINLVDYAMRLRSQARETEDHLGRTAADGLDPYLREVLFGFSFHLPKQVPAEVTFDGRTVDMTDIGDSDYDKLTFLEREQLSRIQRELTLAAVESIHKMLKGWNTTVIHVVLPTAPDWFVEETVALVDQAIPSGNNPVLNAGRLPPDTDDFEGEIFNTHAGGHFTPEFNLYWSERVATLLGALNL